MKHQLARAATSLEQHRSFLQRCQIDTPAEIVDGVWNLVHEYRQKIGSVFDPGAGDGRFALHGRFKKYTGYEIDKKRKPLGNLPKHAQIIVDCAFKATDRFDLCIGNPPYVRHHDIDSLWRDTVVDIIQKKCQRSINRQANAFSYFMWQGLIATKNKGLVAMLVPYEWVSRPSTESLREYIRENNWAVDVYRFSDDVFPRVMTTASITIIDKSAARAHWRYFRIDKSFSSVRLKGPCGTDDVMLGYERTRGKVYAKRGLSPGNQKIFLLTEGDRIHRGLKIDRDVIPAISTLRHTPKSLRILNQNAFLKHFVDAGMRCWIIRSTDNPSLQLKRYLEGIDRGERNTWTCNQRQSWWRYENVDIPRAVFSAGFRDHGPRFLENHVGAVPVGGVCGLHFTQNGGVRKIVERLRGVNFESKVVHHSNSLKKVEVGQMNNVLSQIARS